MGWTYDELQATPHWFVERAQLFFDVRAKWRSKE
jgi:hypothetical protein